MAFVGSRRAALPVNTPDAYALETRQYLARLPTAMSARRAALVDRLVGRLKAAALWDKFDVAYLMAQDDSVTATINLVSGNYKAVPTNSPLFYPRLGFKGVVANSAHLLTGFNPTTAPSPKLTQNSTHLAIFNFTTDAGDGNTREIGNNMAGISNLYFGIDVGGGSSYCRLNQNASTLATTPTDKTGLFVASRVGPLSSDAHVYHNKLGSYLTGNASSQAVDNAEVTILGTPATSKYSMRNLAFASAGSGMSATDVDNLYDALVEYLYDNTVTIATWGDSLTVSNSGMSTPQTWPYRLAHDFLPLRPYVNNGVAGETSTQIKDRLVAGVGSYDSNAIHTIWAGYNNRNAVSTVLADIATMVAAIGTDRYVVIGVPNGPAEYAGTSTYANILSINATLAATYGSHYLPMRERLVASYDSNNAQDLTDHAGDYVPASIRYDGIHPNLAGYGLVLGWVRAKLIELGLAGWTS